MEELVAQVSTIAKGMWRFRWQSLAVAWLVGIVSAVIVFRVPDRYEATARIFVDTQSILKPLMSGLAVQPNVEQQVVMLSRTLISRPNIEKLIRMADLDLKTDSKSKQEALMAELMTTLEIKNIGRDNLYSLSFRDSDPARAQRVIQSLVSIFVESSLGASRKDTASAKTFLNEQIKSYEARLEEAESKLKEFRLRNIQLQSGDGKDSAGRLAMLSDQLDQARLGLREAENSRDAAKAQLASEIAATSNAATQGLLQDSAPAVLTPEIDARLAVQKQNLDSLLQRFTDQHPDIVTTRRLIRELEEQKKNQVRELRKAAMAAPAGGAGASANPVYQELNRLQATAEVQVAAMKARVAEYSARYAQARQMITTAPQLEAEASQLNRDYAVNKKNYEDLVARRESAAMSGDLDVVSGVADFRLIDPPRVSPKPVSPNRLLLLPLALVVALAAGLLFAFAASQLRPVFHHATDLRDFVQLPVLGVISRVVSPLDKRREKNDLLRFVVGSGGLVGTFVVALIAMSVIAARQAG